MALKWSIRAIAPGPHIKRKNNFLFIILLVMSLANIIIHNMAGSFIQQQLFNSDALYLPTLFYDLISKGGKIKDWFLTPAPYFFPDYPEFLLAYLIGSGSYSRIVAFSIIQAVLTFMAVWFLARKIIKSNAFFTAATTSISLIWLALTTTREPFLLLLISAIHYGTFLISIFFIGLWLRSENQQEKQNSTIFYFLIAILTFLSALSDQLFIVQTIAPLAVTTIFIAAVERDFSLKNKLPIFWAMFFAALGSFAYKFIVTNSTRYSVNIGSEKIIANLNEIGTIFFSMILDNPIFGVLLLFYIGIVIHSFFQLAKGAVYRNKLHWLTVFSFLSLCSTIVTVTLATNLPITTRYLIPPFSWPVIVVFIFSGIYLERWFFSVATTISLAAITSLSLNSYALIKTNGLENHYYPAEISCIDDVLERVEVTNGIAQYWNAKYLQNLSRLDLNIAQYGDNLNEYHWITSNKYFKQAYDFAIISTNVKPPEEISSERLIRLNGPPESVESCGDKVIYIYDKDKLRVKEIENVGGAYTWWACELPTRIGEKTAECEMRKKNIAQSGYLTYGPYKELPAGQYNFEIASSSTAAKIDTAGSWSVTVALPNEVRIIKNGLLKGSGGNTEKITGSFTLASSQKIEIRTWAQRNMDLKVIYIRVIRVQ
jgi:hypothetical protein